jgi:hypothetical protein
MVFASEWPRTKGLLVPSGILIRSENFSTLLYFLAAYKETRLAPLWPDLQRFDHGTTTVLLQHQAGARPLIRQRIPKQPSPVTYLEGS